jgi:cyclic beta-1,2-glucan synthetase
MPTLFLPDFAFTLLDETYAGAIARHIEYGKAHGVPWGNAEAGFYAFDRQFNYQYKMFGVPDLSLRREIAPELVVAPYATFLAMRYAPHRAWENLQALRRAGATDGYGYFEALDYTPERRPKGKSAATVKEFMAHHHGMSLAALDNELNGDPLRRRFRREPALAAVELLLQERVPQHPPVVQLPSDEVRVPRPHFLRGPEPNTRVYTTPHTALPRAHILSNGEYSVMLTNAGGGFSAHNDVQVTRWRQDVTRDHWGSFIYIQDLTRRRTWSAAFQPTRVMPDEYEVTNTLERVEYWRQDAAIETRTEIAVSPQENVELRRVTLTNRDLGTRTLQLTSLAEVALAPARADDAHPAFHKLFIESECMVERNLLLFRRRPRAPGQAALWAFHMLTGQDLDPVGLEYETDRTRFIGRGRTAESPRALETRLSNTTGAVLDPVMAWRGRLTLRAGETKRVTFLSGVCDTRDQALELADAYHDASNIERAFDLALVHSRVVLQHLQILPGDAQLFQRLASRVLFPDASLRAPAAVRGRGHKGQPGLWAYGISGDFPIVLLRLKGRDELDLVRQLLRAHEYWLLNNFRTDLVILDESAGSYAPGTADAVEDLVRTSLSHPHMDKPGGVFVRRGAQMPLEDRALLHAAARVVLDGELGALEEQLKLIAGRETYLAPDPSTRGTRSRDGVPLVSPETLKQFDNGLGGFTAGGREYCITLKEGQWTPLPWSNVLANSEGGALVTEAGLGYTWAINSQQNKLTPWSNDPLVDPSGQILYLRDQSSGAVWTPTPLPIREREPYVIRHGAGYTRYEHTSHELEQTLRVFVPPDEPVLVARLTLRNRTSRTRRISAYWYAEWTLGISRDQAQAYVVAEYDSEVQAVLARNTYNPEFGQRVAFAALDQPLAGFTVNRSEFLGRNGTPVKPRVPELGARMSGTRGEALDACAALATEIRLAPGEEKELVCLLGQGRDAPDARQIIERFRETGHAARALEATRARWDELLGSIEIKTPDPALDIMVNRWLPYQALACRIWGRSAFYQSGGAYGFRDQLQDSMALVYSRPRLAREHILRAAARQFVEGDVQHWWHPPSGRGIRTRISDDPLWLPYVVNHYIETTGDHAILDVQLPFLVAPLLAPDQPESFGEPDISMETAALYEHCVRAIEHSLAFGAHGLPLMGTGDWNDGMNAVGEDGRGESVWLAWFLYANLARFGAICERRGDSDRAARYASRAHALAEALEENAWDGAWYRRAYFGDGTPLGSSQNEEARIDAIAQAWAVLSQAASAPRARAALAAVEQFLVRDVEQMILLLAPPFNQSIPSPGYIQGYVPGIRENGGQYTHGALWVVWAMLELGEAERAYELLRMLNPIQHARTPGDVARYQVEPYVVAADIYSHPRHLGRGGWTWYTGSAAWMYRLALEGFIGFILRGDRFTLDPRIPRAWPVFELTWRDGATTYSIRVENPSGVNSGVRTLLLDGTERPDRWVPRVQDGKLHTVRVELG